MYVCSALTDRYTFICTHIYLLSLEATLNRIAPSAGFKDLKEYSWEFSQYRRKNIFIPPNIYTTAHNSTFLIFHSSVFACFYHEQKFKMYFWFSGYSCTRTIIRQARVCKGLPKKSWGTLASPGEEKTGIGNMCFSTGTQGSVEDHLCLLRASNGLSPVYLWTFHSIIYAFLYYKIINDERFCAWTESMTSVHGCLFCAWLLLVKSDHCRRGSAARKRCICNYSIYVLRSGQKFGKTALGR